VFEILVIIAKMHLYSFHRRNGI